MGATVSGETLIKKCKIEGRATKYAKQMPA